MKQFRDTNYYVTEDGKIFRYFPEYYYEYYTNHYGANGIVKKSLQKRRRPEKWKELGYRDNGHGYLKCAISVNNKMTHKRVHQMVAECYVKGYFEGAEVDHIDCNKQNNHYTNLQWCTPEYNRVKGNNPTYPLFSEVCSTLQ